MPEIGSEIPNSESEMPNLKSEIPNPKTEMPTWEFPIFLYDFCPLPCKKGRSTTS